jgi:hypothetical protein
LLLGVDTKLVQNTVEIIISIVLDRKGSAFFRMVDDDAGCQAMREKILQSLDCRREGRFGGRSALGGRFAQSGELLRGEFLRHTDGGALPDYDIHQQPLLVMGFEGKQDLGVANRDAPA